MDLVKASLAGEQAAEARGGGPIVALFCDGEAFAVAEAQLGKVLLNHYHC